MTNQEETKTSFWNDLSKERQEFLIREYQTYKNSKGSGSVNVSRMYYLEELFGKENLDPKLMITYKEVSEKLFMDNPLYYVDSFGKIVNYKLSERDKCKVSEKDFPKIYAPDNCTSEKQAKKLLAINQLMNVAKYLNGDEKLDFSDVTKEKWYFEIEYGNLKYNWCVVMNGSCVYFKDKYSIRQAVEILGEETIRLALSTDW